MGHPMAGHLIKAGNTVYLHRVRGRHRDLLDAGGISKSTAQAVAESSEIVFLMLPETADVEEVLFGEEGVAEGIRPGGLVVDMSSISPIATKKFAGKLAAKEIGYVDAPVSGGEVAAKSASLSIMAGGGTSHFEKVRPYLEQMGKSIIHVGAVGDGQVAKVANQIIVGLTIEAVAEALVFATRSGADPAKVRKAIAGGFASSRILEVHGERMLERKFDPGFRMSLHRKDLGLALDAARGLDLALPNTAATLQLMNGAVGAGLGEKDHSALILMIEQISQGRELHR
jgi:2-hydroxy-3-oxopropionate reductase